MKTPGETVDEILNNIPKERSAFFKRLHDEIIKNHPDGFEAAIIYGGLGYVLPHKIYPARPFRLQA